MVVAVAPRPEESTDPAHVDFPISLPAAAPFASVRCPPILPRGVCQEPTPRVSRRSPSPPRPQAFEHEQDEVGRALGTSNYTLRL